MERTGVLLSSADASMYEVVGGQKFFDRVVDAFYDAVETDQVLIRLYPEGSRTSGARSRLALFLAQYWGGPDTYSQEHGHPRLRMRHAPYVIGEQERDRWLVHMVAAIDVACEELCDERAAEVRDTFVSYVVNAAEHLRNTQ